MEILKEKPHIDFLGYRYVWIGISWLLVAMTAYLWFTTGNEKFGVDFRGGTELVVRFNEDTNAATIRKNFEDNGFIGVIVQAFESGVRDFSIRLSQDESSEAAKTKVRGVLTATQPAGFTLLKEDFVGPIIGEQIRRDAYIAIVLSLIAIMTYVAVRFEWRFGVGGIIALFHDVIIAAGFCLLMGMEMSAGILAALLTIVGYSINDTIIVYDRIRENLEKARKTKKGAIQNRADLMALMNASVNETLSRTILTSLTAFIVVTILWLFGGGAVADMSFALMVGIATGTYSSIFVACPTVLAFHGDASAKKAS